MSATAVDYILSIPLGTDDSLEEELQASLYLTACEGSVIVASESGTFLECYFASAADREVARTVILSRHSIAMTMSDRDRIDWLERYEDSLVAKNIGERFVVAPRADLIPSGDRIGIVIPQERAFGTGNHETTALCLALLEQVDCRGALGLDIGTGSGILAIGMAKLGCRRVFAFDNDPEILGIVEENAARNAITLDRVATFIGGPEALAGDRFDLATMNILPEVIVPLLPHVRSILRNGATLIVSGILVEKSAWVTSHALENRFTLADQCSEGEWWAGKLIAHT